MTIKTFFSGTSKVGMAFVAMAVIVGVYDALRHFWFWSIIMFVLSLVNLWQALAPASRAYLRSLVGRS